MTTFTTTLASGGSSYAYGDGCNCDHGGSSNNHGENDDGLD